MLGAPTMTSVKPSPLTSPADATDDPACSYQDEPTIVKPFSPLMFMRSRTSGITAMVISPMVRATQRVRSRPHPFWMSINALAPIRIGLSPVTDDFTTREMSMTLRDHVLMTNRCLHADVSNVGTV